MNTRSTYQSLSRIIRLEDRDSGPELLVKAGGGVLSLPSSGLQPDPLAWITRRVPSLSLPSSGLQLDPKPRPGRRFANPWGKMPACADGLLRGPAGLCEFYQRHQREMLYAIHHGIRSPPLKIRSEEEKHAYVHWLEHQPVALDCLQGMAEIRRVCRKDDEPFGDEDDWVSDQPDRLETRQLQQLIFQRLQKQPYLAAPARRARRERQLKTLLRTHQNLKTALAWLDKFPADALEFLDRHGFVQARWPLMLVWIRVPGLRQLMQDNPTLAWFIAHGWYFSCCFCLFPQEQLRSLATRPRRELLAALKIPGGDGMLDLLKRIDCKALSPTDLGYLVRALRDPVSVRWLQNLSGTISVETISFLGRKSPITFPILAATHEGRRIEGTTLSVARCFEDTRTLADLLQDPAAQRQLGTIRSVHRLHDLHNRLHARYNREENYRIEQLKQSWREPIPSPLSPLPSWLIPLSTFESVKSEGLEMNHCVAIYISRVVAGGYYLYRVEHANDRATLAIRQKDGCWRIEQLSGVRNRKVNTAVHTAIEIWLRQTQDVR